MRSRRSQRNRSRSFPPSRGWRAWLGSLQRSASRRRQAWRERASLVARAETQDQRLRAHHERFRAAWRDREAAHLRREQAVGSQPDTALRNGLRRLALEGPQSDAWIAVARARLEAGQGTAGLEAAAEAVRLGLLPPAALAAMAAGAGHASPIARIFRAERLSAGELGELYQALRGWPEHRVLRHVLLRELFDRVTDHEEQVRLAERTATLHDGSRTDLEAAVRDAWRDLAGQPTIWDADTVAPQDVWLYDAPYDWAPALQCRLSLASGMSAEAAAGVRFTQRPAAFDSGAAWSRRRCRQYLLGKDPTAPQAAPQALPLLRRLHSEAWRLVGFECLAEAWPPPGDGAPADLRIGDLPAAQLPEVAYLLAYDAGDLRWQASLLTAGWDARGERPGVPWTSLVLATARSARAAEAAVLRDLATAFGRRFRRGDAAAAAPWLMGMVRSEQLDGRPAAPAAQPLLTELATLQGEALDAAIVALAACTDGAAPGWLRAVEEAFLRRLERSGAAAAMSPAQLDMLLETLAHAQVAARVTAWMDDYRAAVAAWSE